MRLLCRPECRRLLLLRHPSVLVVHLLLVEEIVLVVELGHLLLLLHLLSIIIVMNVHPLKLCLSLIYEVLVKVIVKPLVLRVLLRLWLLMHLVWVKLLLLLELLVVWSPRASIVILLLPELVGLHLVKLILVLIEVVHLGCHLLHLGLHLGKLLINLWRMDLADIVQRKFSISEDHFPRLFKSSDLNLDYIADRLLVILDISDRLVIFDDTRDSEVQTAENNSFLDVLDEG